ncbi:myosin-1B-like [Macrobrachium nipponense]|uniref:myosin-1B-like n=1 Tax=Macrobrachium nipponense TaxID=159736 RepID=UPI0030C859B7
MEKEEDLKQFEKELLEHGQMIHNLEDEVIALMEEEKTMKAGLENEIKDLKVELLNLQSLNMEKEEDLKQFDKELTERGQMIHNLEDEVIALMEEKKSLKAGLENEIKDLKVELLNLQSLNMEKEEDLKQFEKELTERGQLIHSLENEVIALLEEKKSLKAGQEKEINDLKVELLNLQSLNMEKEEEVKQFEKELLEHGQMIHSLEDEVIALMEEEKTMKAGLENEIKDLKVELLNLKSLNMEKEEDLKQFDKELTERGQMIHNLEDEVIALNGEKKSLKAGLENEIKKRLKVGSCNLQSLNMEKEEDLKQFEKELTERGQLIHSLEDEVIALMEEKKTLKAGQEKEINNLKVELLNLQSLNMEKGKEIGKLNKEVIETGEAIAGLENEIIELIEDNQKRKTKMEEEIKDHKEELINLRDMNPEKDKEIKKFKYEAIEIGEAIKGLENEVIKLMEDNKKRESTMEKKITNLKELLINLQNNNLKKDEEIKKLKNEEIEFRATIEGKNSKYRKKGQDHFFDPHERAEFQELHDVHQNLRDIPRLDLTNPAGSQSRIMEDPEEESLSAVAQDVASSWASCLPPSPETQPLFHFAVALLVPVSPCHLKAPPSQSNSQDALEIILDAIRDMQQRIVALEEHPFKKSNYVSSSGATSTQKNTSLVRNTQEAQVQKTSTASPIPSSREVVVEQVMAQVHASDEICPHPSMVSFADPPIEKLSMDLVPEGWQPFKDGMSLGVDPGSIVFADGTLFGPLSVDVDEHSYERPIWRFKKRSGSSKKIKGIIPVRQAYEALFDRLASDPAAISEWTDNPLSSSRRCGQPTTSSRERNTKLRKLALRGCFMENTLVLKLLSSDPLSKDLFHKDALEEVVTQADHQAKSMLTMLGFRNSATKRPSSQQRIRTSKRQKNHQQEKQQQQQQPQNRDQQQGNQNFGNYRRNYQNQYASSSPNRRPTPGNPKRSGNVILMAERTSVSRWQVEQILGRLQFASIVDPVGKALLKGY